MSLVLLTLYSVIHFIINSLLNVLVSVLIRDTQLDMLMIPEGLQIISFRHKCKQVNKTLVKRFN